MKKGFIFILVCLFSINVIAGHKKEKKPKKERTKFIFSLDARNSKTLEENVKVSGIKLGLQFRGKYRLGLGFYELQKKLVLASIVKQGTQFDLEFTFKHSNIYYERILYNDFRWDVSIPVSLGGGNSFLNVINRTTDKIIETQKGEDVGVVTVGVAGHYRVFPWIGVGAGFGYRQVITKEEGVRDLLSDVFYSYKLKIFLGYLYKGIFHPEKVQAEKEKYKNR